MSPGAVTPHHSDSLLAMLNRPAVLIIAAAFGLLFLIISVYNTRSLNNSLMEKLVETEVMLLLLVRTEDQPGLIG